MADANQPSGMNLCGICRAYESNLDLSKRRADTVVADLVSTYGIEASRLFAAGASFLAPVANNDTEEGRTLNRRVELVRAP